MPTPGAYTTPDAVPRATQRVAELDGDWKNEARCRGHAGHMRFAWTIDSDRKHPTIDGVERRDLLTTSVITMALTICRTCPVQYECVSWAVYVDETGGTWGLSVNDLKWLKGREDSEAFIRAAERRHTPIQVAVRRARAV